MRICLSVFHIGKAVFQHIFAQLTARTVCSYNMFTILTLLTQFTIMYLCNYDNYLLSFVYIGGERDFVEVRCEVDDYCVHIIFNIRIIFIEIY